MIRNLKFNKEKLKNIKTKLCIGLTIFGLGLTGCNINHFYTDENNQEYSVSDEQQPEYATLNINTVNLSSDKLKDEMIGLGNPDSGIYTIFQLTDEDFTKVVIECNDKESIISSSVLEKYIVLGRVEKDDIVNLEIDYLTKTMNVNIISKDKTMH